MNRQPNTEVRTMGDLFDRLDGAQAIAYERTRQVIQEFYHPNHDDRHDEGQLLAAAICYAIQPEQRQDVLWLWPWAASDWKPSPTDRRRELIKAGALIAAEIDRLDRAPAPAIEPTEQEGPRVHPWAVSTQSAPLGDVAGCRLPARPHLDRVERRAGPMVDRLAAGVATMTDERLLQALDVLGACVRSKLGTSCELVPEDDGGEFETFTCVTHGETVLEEFETCPVRKALHLAAAPSEPRGES